MSRRPFAAMLLAMLSLHAVARAAEPAPTGDEARAALLKAAGFYAGKVASHGGYVYKYADDLAKREGEGKTGPDTVWVQPPGTPTVGLAFLEAHARTGDAALLDAARAAGDCLIRGQLRSGGWTASIEFDPAERGRFAYRVDPPNKGKKKPFDVSTFDDDKTQSAVRFLCRLDKALAFKDARVHECVTTALDAILKAQFPNGGWAQGWEGPAEDRPVQPASFPDDWPRKHPGGAYWWHYTTNDNNISTIVDTLLVAAEVYDDPKYMAAVKKAGDFILLAQLPDPQPAWAQQYDADMHPVWARKFEPPAVSGGESQHLLQTLLQLYVVTGDNRYVAPVPKALAYLRKSQLPDGRLARFYELRTNRPLYLTTTYELTFDDADLPTHYGFKVPSKLDQIAREHDRLAKMTGEQLAAERARPAKEKAADAAAVRRAIAAMDDRGAWVEDGVLKYHGKADPTKRIIDSATFAKNMDLLSRYVAAK